MYVVRFVRTDGRPDEEYYYHILNDAVFHFNLFENDDSGIFSMIELLEVAQKSTGNLAFLQKMM